MTPAEQLFNETFGRWLTGYRVILSFRQVVAIGLPKATEVLSTHYSVFVQELMEGQEYAGIITDKDAFFKAMPPQHFVQLATRNTINDATAAADAASLVFAHSIIDGVSLDYCRVSMLAAPQDWSSSVEKRKVELTQVRATSYDVLLRKELDDLAQELERESLTKKVDLLFAKCQPPPKWEPLSHFQFDIARLIALDKLRQDMVHGEALGSVIPRCDEEIEFLMKIGLLLMSLVNFRYGFKLNPWALAQLKGKGGGS